MKPSNETIVITAMYVTVAVFVFGVGLGFLVGGC